MKLRVNNLDLGYTIDTYGMFTGEGVEDLEAEYYKDEYGISDPNLIEFDYDHKGVVQALASESVDILEDELKGDIVKSITLEKYTSPQFYNYTTDSYIATWNIDEYKLEEYCTNNLEAFETFRKENWQYEWQNAIDDDDTDTLAVIKLDFYTRQELPIDDYNSKMFEFEFEAWSENMKPTKEFQKLIDRKEVTK